MSPRFSLSLRLRVLRPSLSAARRVRYSSLAAPLPDIQKQGTVSHTFMMDHLPYSTVLMSGIMRNCSVQGFRQVDITEDRQNKYVPAKGENSSFWSLTSCLLRWTIFCARCRKSAYTCSSKLLTSGTYRKKYNSLVSLQDCTL